MSFLSAIWSSSYGFHSANFFSHLFQTFISKTPRDSAVPQSNAVGTLRASEFPLFVPVLKNRLGQDLDNRSVPRMPRIITVMLVSQPVLRKFASC